MQYVVAVDGSTEADQAVAYAATHAAGLGADLEVVHVVEPETELIDGEIVLPGADRATDIGEQVLNRARQRASDAVGDRDDLETDTTLLTGRPSDAIADYADRAGADAIYLGHRGLSAEREQVVGSVAKSVVDKATVPVTIIR
ncbi:universal stress protein UspA [Halobellus salinus]|uniref:Universal stress protein UspA n=1 Tax=Halobellus salinus TaxID=931585 RepID=A0A830EPD4_9EURY|nr:universal stress protein [Halobellus salinus]GGI96955.1 universal stress protein UspA [Halobellus salinus]SMP13592.1 Nucleotide-binding universal stress protein, UspA family [Halobellus salinus]